jgi:hypothetical protein
MRKPVSNLVSVRGPSKHLASSRACCSASQPASGKKVHREFRGNHLDLSCVGSRRRVFQMAEVAVPRALFRAILKRIAVLPGGCGAMLTREGLPLQPQGQRASSVRPLRPSGSYRTMQPTYIYVRSIPFLPRLQVPCYPMTPQSMARGKRMTRRDGTDGRPFPRTTSHPTSGRMGERGFALRRPDCTSAPAGER